MEVSVCKIHTITHMLETILSLQKILNIRIGLVSTFGEVWLAKICFWTYRIA